MMFDDRFKTFLSGKPVFQPLSFGMKVICSSKACSYQISAFCRMSKQELRHGKLSELEMSFFQFC